MKKLAMTGALVGALFAATPGWGAEASSPCYTQSAIEAEQAIRYITEVMVASSACQNTTYAEFRLRNRDAIVAYQKAMISHFRGESAFDRWNTALANYAAQKQAAVNLGVFCPQAHTLMKQAKALDPTAFRAYAASQAATAGAQYAKCGGAREEVRRRHILQPLPRSPAQARGAQGGGGGEPVRVSLSAGRYRAKARLNASDTAR